MRILEINGAGLIVNAIEAADLTSVRAGHTGLASDVYEIGGTYLNEVYTPPPGRVFDRPFNPLTRRQFGAGMWKRGKIATAAAAKAFVIQGTLTTGMTNYIATLPAADRDDVEMMLSGDALFYRTNPHIVAIGAALSWTPAQFDNFWRFAESIT